MYVHTRDLYAVLRPSNRLAILSISDLTRDLPNRFGACNIYRKVNQRYFSSPRIFSSQDAADAISLDLL